MLRLQIYSRYRAKCSVYFDICREESNEFRKVFDILNELFNDENWLKRINNENPTEYLDDIPLLNKRERLQDKAITFGVMCLEAFIYDYAATNFSDKFCKNFLDKLDLVSKWVLIPKLVLGKEFPRDSKAFELLVKLTKYRNDLVHAKSVRMPPGDFKDNPKQFLETLFPDRGKKDIEQLKLLHKYTPFDIVVLIFQLLREMEDETGEISTQWWQLQEVDGDNPMNKYLS